MPFFPKSSDPARNNGAEERPSDAKLSEELSELAASEHPRKVDKAKTEAERAISNATIADIRGITLIERGRCPECSARTEALLFTTVCPSCGWYQRFTVEAGCCVVHLDTGAEIKCERVFSVKGDQLLCVTDNVVRHQVAKSAVRLIDYIWQADELAKARERYHKERGGVCSWCDKSLDEVDPEDVIEEFVAFGTFQERYLFCSEKCLRSFRKQYPVRIHRNCYETECIDCEECSKRFDVSSFSRHVIDEPS